MSPALPTLKIGSPVGPSFNTLFLLALILKSVDHWNLPTVFLVFKVNSTPLFSTSPTFVNAVVKPAEEAIFTFNNKSDVTLW